VTDRVQTGVTMQNRLGELPTPIQRLRSVPKLLSGVLIRGAHSPIAMREALPNTLTHDNQSDALKMFSCLIFSARPTRGCRS
jgi:hypothetical protein